MKKGKVKLNKKRLLICIIIVVVIITLIYLFFNNVLNTQTKYIVVNGYVEKAMDANSIVIKDEIVLDVDNKSSIITTIEQGKRVAKDGIVAIYQNSRYNEYLENIKNLDSQIQTLIKDLPPTYSNEISNIDMQISDIAINSKNINSRIKMQEYKSKLNELSTKKVNVLASLSPTGSKIKELIEQRDELKIKSGDSSDNIKAPVSGMITYKIDSLETEIDFKNVLNYTSEEFKKFFDKYQKNNINNFGIKIIDNFNAYIVAKIDTDIYDSYIKENNTYKIKLNNDSKKEYNAFLSKYISTDNERYAIFYIQNGIEELVDSRLESIEIIWNTTSGMAVIKDAIYDSDAGYKYVILIYGGNYIQIPINIKSEDDNIAIVENFSDDDYKKYNLTKGFKLSIYDILVIDENKEKNSV